jgi:hypothetical protein
MSDDNTQGAAAIQNTHMTDQEIRMSDPTTATPGLEGPLCYGYTRDGVWLDTYYGWVIPNDAADTGRSRRMSHAFASRLPCGPGLLHG